MQRLALSEAKVKLDKTMEECKIASESHHRLLGEVDAARRAVSEARNEAAAAYRETGALQASLGASLAEVERKASWAREQMETDNRKLADEVNNSDLFFCFCLIAHLNM